MNDDQKKREFKVVIYGLTGTGKTTLCVTAPNPVFLLTERQGFESIRTAAKRLGRPVPPTFLIQTVEHMRAALRALRSPEPLKALCVALIPDAAEAKRVFASLPYQVPGTVVLDGVTEAAKTIADDIDATAPPKAGKDGLPVKSDRYWFVLGERAEQMIRAFRDLPFHVVFLAGEDDREVGEDDQKTRVVGPSLPMRKLAPALGHAANIVGRMRIAEVTELVDGKPVTRHVRYVQLSAPSWIMTKTHEPLSGNERPNLSSWFARLEGALDPESATPVIPEAPKTEAPKTETQKTETTTTEEVAHV
jgi:hypothetical protein